MNSDKIRFNCPACGIQLDVPASLAGVTGPCPSCRSAITAPHPQPTPQPLAPPVQPQAQAPQPAPLPPQPIEPQARPAQPHQEESYPQNYHPPVEAAPPETELSGRGQNVFPTVVPDQPPAQTTNPQVHPMPDDTAFPVHEEPVRQTPQQTIEPTAERSGSGSGATATAQGSRLPSILFLLLTLIALTLGVLAVLSYTGIVDLGLKSLFGGKPAASSETRDLHPPSGKNESSPPSPSGTSTSEPAPVVAPPTPSLPEDPTSIDPEQSNQLEQEGPAPRLPDGEDFREGETPLPDEISANSNDPREVQKILESFLAAQSLEERSPFLSTESITNPEIKTSPLANKLPIHTTSLFLDVHKDDQENRTDFFYVVSWDGSNGTPIKPITVELHKWPGSEPPRVQSEAFLEFYQEKLARYAATPRDKPARFFVIAECVSGCFETDLVSDHSSKATLKLGAFPNDRSPVKAYFDKKGDLLEQLKGYRDGLCFRKDIPMTITLAWSKANQRGQRYLEVIKIDSFDWHP